MVLRLEEGTALWKGGEYNVVKCGLEGVALLEGREGMMLSSAVLESG